ncbi:hypothetical protein [Paraburkholderia ribeironis]|nr:hypothetical protein [Paraburkholderia ribeironis]
MSLGDELEPFVEGPLAHVAIEGLNNDAASTISIVAPRTSLYASQVRLTTAILVCAVSEQHLRTFDWSGAVLQSLTSVGSDVMSVFRLSSQYTQIGDGLQSKNKATLQREICEALARLDVTANRFAEVVAENWRADTSQPQQWQEAFHHAKRLGDSASPVQAFACKWSACDTPTDEPEPRSEISRIKRTPATVQKNRLPRHRTRPERPSVAVNLPQASTDALVRRENLKHVADILHKSKQLTPDAVREAAYDALTLARQFGRDISTIEAMSTSDPLALAHTIRDSFESWFGSVAQLSLARKKLAVLKSDPEVRAYADQIDQRTNVLEQIQTRMNQQEGDSIKQYAYPKGTHLHRLFHLDEVAQVRAPRKLASESDYGNLGTLFELCVELHPISNGAAADPIFVHLHAQHPVTTDQCLSLALDDCSAVHIKTTRQKNLGRNWEKLQVSLGKIGVTVHRGEIDKALWCQLRKKAGAPS